LGQNAALLCRVWCHPGQSANGACEHQVPMTAPSMTGNESCAPVAAGPAAFVREAGRGSAAASAVHPGTAVARFLFVPPSSSSARALERAQATALAARPLVLALRI
jgi:hypothetical protein